MAVITRNADQRGRREINLNGPAGNAFSLMGQAQSFAKQLGWTREQTKEMIDDMTSGDYEHLLEVFDNHFGSFVDLIREEEDEDDY